MTLVIRANTRRHRADNCLTPRHLYTARTRGSAECGLASLRVADLIPKGNFVAPIH